MAFCRSNSLYKTVSNVLSGSKPVLKEFNRFCSEKPKKFTDGPIDPEVNFHSSLAAQWWDMKTVSPLHSMNEVRVPFITNGINQLKPLLSATAQSSIPFLNVNILDVGCGGGILSEALARLKANVTGLDLSPDLIKIARKHAELDHRLKGFLTYEVESIHNYCTKNVHRFDAVVVSEVIEHIFNKEKFIEDCLTCLKPGGSIFFTTPNRTLLARIMIVTLAESIGIIPIGTHDYEKFVTPEELSKLLKDFNCSIKRVEGVFYNPVTGKFSFVAPKWLMYALHAQKIR